MTTSTTPFNGFATNRAGQLNLHFSQRVKDAFATLNPEQQATLTTMAERMTINLIIDNKNGSVKVYTSTPGSGVAMVQNKKVWWLNVVGKATTISYKW